MYLYLFEYILCAWVGKALNSVKQHLSKNILILLLALLLCMQCAMPAFAEGEEAAAAETISEESVVADVPEESAEETVDEYIPEESETLPEETAEEVEDPSEEAEEPTLAEESEEPASEESMEVPEEATEEPAADADSKEPSEGPDEAETFTVTYERSDGSVISTETVAAGESPVKIPESVDGKSVTNWLQKSGDTISGFVIPSVQSITADISFVAWFAPALKTNHFSYINGTSEWYFNPSGKLTRAQAAKIVYSLLDNPGTGPYPVTFSDVKNSSWYYEAVMCLASYKIVQGDAGTDTFRPNDNITRAEFISILSRLYPLTVGTGESKFSDCTNVKSWYYNAVQSAGVRGWVKGYEEDGKTLFKPKNNITRAEAVTMVNGVLGRTPDTDYIDKLDYRPFSDIDTSWAFYQIMEAAIEHEYSGSGSTEAWTSDVRVGHVTDSYALENHLLNVSGTYYYVNSDGTFASWTKGAKNKIGSKYYCAPRNGCQLSYPNYNTSTGTATAGKYKVNGTWYYFKKDGSVLAQSEISTHENTFEDLSAKQMYHVCSDNSLTANGYVGNLYFNSNAVYTTGDSTLDNLIYNFLESTGGNLITRTDYSQYDKLKAAYDLMRAECGYSPLYNTTDGGGSLVAEAKWMLSNRRTWSYHGTTFKEKLPGDCYGWSSTMALLARRLGYDCERQTGYISSNPHAWEVIHWNSSTDYILDVELEWGHQYGYYTSTLPVHALFMLAVSPSASSYYCASVGTYYW